MQKISSEVLTARRQSGGRLPEGSPKSPFRMERKQIARLNNLRFAEYRRLRPNLLSPPLAPDCPRCGIIHQPVIPAKLPVYGLPRFYQTKLEILLPALNPRPGRFAGAGQGLMLLIYETSQ
jgi:hypothetical protein